MANLEESVASLEAHTDRHAAAVEGLRADMGQLRTEIAAIRTDMALRSETAELQRELAAVRAEMATRAEVADLRTELHGHMTALRTELRSDMAGLRADLRELSRRTDRFVIWVAGTQAAVLMAVIGVLVSVVVQVIHPRRVESAL